MPSTLKVASQVTGAIVRGLLDPRVPVSRKMTILMGFTASGVRLARGTIVGRLGPRPERPFVLWDFERCPHSRSVREALSCLDLDAEVRPCPLGGTRFRPQLDGGHVPRLEDPNTGQCLVGSSLIVGYLYERYGSSRAPWLINSGPARVVTGLAVRALTFGRGARARPSKAPAQPLELYSFESSPYSRMVRFTLCELELPYLLHNIAKGSKRRRAFVERAGKMQVPWLHDPNTGWQGYESLEIDRYLEATYAVR